MLVCATMSICNLLILPFVTLYTSGINDVRYIDKWLPILFCSVQILTWVRYASGNLTSLAGYAKKMGNVSIIEAIINLGTTIVLTNIFGIRGALCGTIIALLYKSNYLLLFVNRKILVRSATHSYKICLSNVLLFFVIAYLGKYINLTVSSYLNFFKYAVIISLILYPAFYLYNLVINRAETLYYSKIITSKILSRIRSFK